MPRSHPALTVVYRDQRAELDHVGRAAAIAWMRTRVCWLPGELCDHLIAEEIVQTRRGLLIEAFRAVDTLHQELIAAGELEPIPAEHGLLYGWKRRHG